MIHFNIISKAHGVTPHPVTWYLGIDYQCINLYALTSHLERCF